MVKKISQMTPGEQKDFEFAEHQLGVIDTKANNVLLVDSVLIVISTMSMLFEKNIDPFVKFLSTLATICVLFSVILCIRTIWTKWATELTQDGVEALRDHKTKFLNTGLIVLFVALSFYVAMFIANFIITVK